MGDPGTGAKVFPNQAGTNLSESDASINDWATGRRPKVGNSSCPDNSKRTLYRRKPEASFLVAKKFGDGSKGIFWVSNPVLKKSGDAQTHPSVATLGFGYPSA
jgi:hypothetical protein